MNAPVVSLLAASLVPSLFFLLSISDASPVRAGEQAASERFGHQDVPTRQLSKEHDITLKVAAAAESLAAQLHSGQDIDKQRLVDLHDFFVNFVDACHHGKEERFYFPVSLIARPDLQQEVTTLKLHHDLGKSLLSGIDRALAIWDEKPEQARREAADDLSAYCIMLNRHIDIESEQLMKQAETALSLQQQEVIRAGFHYIEAEELGEGFHEKYHDLAMKILEQNKS